MVNSNDVTQLDQINYLYSIKYYLLCLISNWAKKNKFKDKYDQNPCDRVHASGWLGSSKSSLGNPTNSGVLLGWKILTLEGLGILQKS